MTASWIEAGLAIVLGACAGSYATTAAMRTARAEQSTLGRSHCDSCRVPLTMAQTVPVISFSTSGGRCAACGARIDPLHPVGEITGAAIALASISLAPFPQALLLGALGLVLLASSIVDARTLRLPDLLTAAAAVLCATLASLQGLEALLVGLATAVAAGVVLQCLRWGFQAAKRDPGLGLGDVKLIAALALWLGPATAWVVVLASVGGLVLMAMMRPKDGRLAFGPLIAGSAWIIGLAMEANLGHS